MISQILRSSRSFPQDTTETQHTGSCSLEQFVDAGSAPPILLPILASDSHL